MCYVDEDQRLSYTLEPFEEKCIRVSRMSVFLQHLVSYSYCVVCALTLHSTVLLLWPSVMNFELKLRENGIWKNISDNVAMPLCVNCKMSPSNPFTDFSVHHTFCYPTLLLLHTSTLVLHLAAYFDITSIGHCGPIIKWRIGENELLKL